MNATPILRNTSLIPVRVALSIMPATVIWEPGTSSAEARGNAALEGSPGTSRSKARRVEPEHTSISSPSPVTFAPIALSIRSVWSRERPPPRTVVEPTAVSPESNNADLTWAEATVMP